MHRSDSIKESNALHGQLKLHFGHLSFVENGEREKPKFGIRTSQKHWIPAFAGTTEKAGMRRKTCFVF